MHMRVPYRARMHVPYRVCMWFPGIWVVRVMCLTVCMYVCVSVSVHVLHLHMLVPVWAPTSGQRVSRGAPVLVAQPLPQERAAASSGVWPVRLSPSPWRQQTSSVIHQVQHYNEHKRDL